MNEIQQAIAAMGGQAAAARALGITPGLVWQWVKGRRTIGPDHCPAIERASGIPCERLRADLTWTRNEAGEITGYHVRLNAA